MRAVTLHTLSAVMAVADLRSLILYLLGYISSIGVMLILLTALDKKACLTNWMRSARAALVSRVTVSFVVGSLFWLVLLTYPTLLWIPISLFLVISLGAAT